MDWQMQANLEALYDLLDQVVKDCPYDDSLITEIDEFIEQLEAESLSQAL